MQVEVDAAHGGRWTSMRGRTGREWLRRNDIPGRDTVRPGDGFVDAGGLEECLPTIDGDPDHGAVWSRPWTAAGDALRVEVEPFVLVRRIRIDDSGITASYRLEGPPGVQFIWAAHTLIDISRRARLLVPTGRAIWVNDPVGTTDAFWPGFRGTDLSGVGEDDGTALMIIVPELRTVSVLDGDDVLTMGVEVQGQPSGVAIWRNLGGWPAESPYRSFAIEPMLGYSPTLALAREGEAAVIPATGVVEWTLTVDG
jgi:hypothetical protein